MKADLSFDVGLVRPFAPISPADLGTILGKISAARVAVVGDFCLDVYWFLDLSRSEVSLETGLLTNPVREQRCALGGAGNVVSNLRVLGCRHITALGVVGNDLWGREMRRQLNELGVSTDLLITQPECWITPVYVKPYLGDREQPRFDLGSFNELSPASAQELLARLRSIIPNVDAVVINQQLQHGVHTPAVRQGLEALVQQFENSIFIADTRHYGDAYPGAVLKLNEHEALRVCGFGLKPDESAGSSHVFAAADTLFRRWGRPVVITRGQRGVVLRDMHGLHPIPAPLINGPTDPVGAGDSFLAGFCLGLAAGCEPPIAAQLGNLVAGVTVQKLHETGTATPAEVLALARTARYAKEIEA